MSQGTVMAFDCGVKRFGIAVGEASVATASPLETVHARDGKPDWGRIERLVSEWRPAQMVVGIAFHADGSDQAMTQRARRFAQELEQRYLLPVALIDERLSSAEAEALLAETGRSRIAVDAAAAAVILRTWMTQHNDVTKEKHYGAG